ncbi:hypothetical protein EC973_000126 [Apophysomyces ossiformis]|uniref:Uncharacterized protein n=1 Tax=Apophysomyces ossiformis TaxID=679940 RepID=A0A8H7EUC9_9FUNG|nr:hypothetical protein EC973_000126 [Apophysomyces ossiformis]
MQPPTATNRAAQRMQSGKVSGLQTSQEEKQRMMSSSAQQQKQNNNKQQQQKLQEQIARLQNEIEELQLEREESKKNVLHFMEEAESAKQTLHKTQAALDELLAIRKNSNKSNDDENGRVALAHLTAKLAHLTIDEVDQLLKVHEALNQRTRERDEALQKIRLVEQDREEVRQTLEQQRQEHEVTRKALQAEQDRADVLEQRWKDSESGLEQAEAKVQHLEHEIERWRKQAYDGLRSAETEKARSSLQQQKEEAEKAEALQALEDRYRSRVADLEMKLDLGEKDHAMLQEKQQQLEAKLRTFHDQQNELDQARIRENHLKTTNKTLREELRKSQQQEDEAINTEYLKNVILKFLERKQTRIYKGTLSSVQVTINPTNQTEINMDPSKTNAKYNQAAGNVRETAGNMMGNERMQAEGQTQNASGQTEESTAKTQNYMSGLANEIKGKVSGAMSALTGDQSGQAAAKRQEMGGTAQKKWNE